jgi:methylglutaconyl-CoA hydratase
VPQFVTIATRDRTSWITIARPDLHNAFNEVVIAELTAAFRAAGSDPAVRVVVLAGEGKSFCAGADIHWMKRMVDYTVAENVADANAMADMLRAIRECPRPVIGRVHGAAYGGGVGLTAACDMAVTLDVAAFCLSEVKLGIIPAVISPYVLEKIGQTHMRRYGLTAERFDGREAKRIGLVSESVETVEAMDAWIAATAAALAANGPEALAACKQVLREVAQTTTWDEAQALTTKRIAERRVSAEGQDGLKAFLEKRNPQWM